MTEPAIEPAIDEAIVPIMPAQDRQHSPRR